MIAVRRLGHATLTTPDLDAQVEYYTEVVGLSLIECDKDRAILASRQGGFGSEPVIRGYQTVE